MDIGGRIAGVWFCAAKRRQNDWQLGNELGAVSVITGYENGGERRNRHTR